MYFLNILEGLLIMEEIDYEQQIEEYRNSQVLSQLKRAETERRENLEKYEKTLQENVNTHLQNVREQNEKYAKIIREIIEDDIKNRPKRPREEDEEEEEEEEYEK